MIFIMTSMHSEKMMIDPSKKQAIHVVDVDSLLLTLKEMINGCL
ncbi:metallo-beta-lactamase [Lacticaseibacillus rhamnosus]|nr:metallo-beta-lactamase [Lacticaseibacillus rhamnosus]MCT3172749.1 metallo-beta-lactamase [Lacticaseibacillus rhamnosus]MCT3179336.1 metallo-beta-lactamase [Lacticaseibacillus rhamnosus]MCT3182206.1 metallo-beta-lactamase [Lacticaseibacillus rhamnosus]MCT3183020.1 metallo-beta-lactamase [Lacticaseibacillus rhamnosus]